MQYLGEIIAIVVAFSWTFTALFFEYAGKRLGSIQLNLIRLVFGMLMLGTTLFCISGHFFPVGADAKTWLWMSLSGLVGFVFGDFCLFYSYILISSRFSQLIMTLAPPFAAVFGYFLLGERTGFIGIAGMLITLAGIAISVLKRSNGESKHLHFHLPLRGLLFALGGALGQGLGIVLSKKGMMYYEQSFTDAHLFSNYIPFAATEIRIITGILGFSLIILFTKRLPTLKKALKDRRGMWAALGGSFFGPFLGVSLSLMAVQHTETGIASTIMATVPVLILLPYALLYKTKIKPVEILGAILCVAGVACFFLR